MFQENHSYSREDIHLQLGGGIQDMLPHLKGRVVCVCVRPDIHPDAPDILLISAANSIYRWACVFCNQKFPIPAFLRQQSKQWLYIGPYFVEAWTENRAEIAIHSQRAKRHDIQRVLFLTKFSDPRLQLRP